MPLPVDAVLHHLRLDHPAPDRAFLDRLLRAWSQRIPWESASRIARHQRPGTPRDHARRPAAFFADAIRLNTGGTCFESNLALRPVLDALGFSSTLAFCDMQERGAWQIDPHSALIVTLDGQRYLADVGYPIPGTLRLDPDAPTTLETATYHYQAVPVAPERWEVRRTSGDFASTCFWLKGVPIAEEAFWARLVQDHEPGGFFLTEVIIQKYAGNCMWRYSEGKGLVRRTWGREEPVALTDAEQADLPGTLARRFGLDARVIRAALARTPPDGVWE